ncbi:UNVERIFIED_CONTAM: hypothetical protein NCL1_52539 [Trichonephila clavipes]
MFCFQQSELRSELSDLSNDDNAVNKTYESLKAIAGSPPSNKSILTHDEDNRVVIPLAERSKCYDPPAIHVMPFILAILR